MGIERLHPGGHTPLISVIIPAYNCAAYVAEAIQSVLDQSFCDHEIIVVDDGSSDDTRAVAGRFEAVQLIAGPHRGNAAARNAGAARARGAWLCFLDADDRWVPHKLERQLDHLLGRRQCAVCFPGAWWFYEDDGRTEALPTGPPAPEALWRYLVWYQPFGASLSGVMMRRECFEETGGFDEDLQLSVDWDMWIRLAERYAMTWFDERLVHVRLHRHNANRASEVRLRMYLACLQKHRRLFCETLGMRAAWHASYGSRLLRLGRYLLKNGHLARARSVLMQSLRYGGNAQVLEKAALILECRLRAWRLTPLFETLRRLKPRPASA